LFIVDRDTITYTMNCWNWPILFLSAERFSVGSVR